MQRTDSWPAPNVPSLPGDAVAVQLYDSARQQTLPVATHDGSASIYVCGITPYDATHLGHAATYVAFDTCIRALRQQGISVRYAQNITDVDDPLFERATQTGADWRELAASQTDLFRSDMTALRVIPPNDYVRVQDVIPQVADAVALLLERGFAYAVETTDASGQDIYLDIQAVQRECDFRVGCVSHYSPPELSERFVEFGGDPEREGKRCSFDPLLWRAAREHEPSWNTQVGAGRPGWHVECAVIALQTLAGTPGPTSITIQAGGADLKFPHHEMTAAHACALSGAAFASHFAHAGLVAYQGEKMSKSLGNLVLVSKLMAAGVDAAAIRLAILRNHYRSNWEWDDALLAAANEQLQRWREAAKSASDDLDDVDEVQRMRVAIAADLDTPQLIQIVDEWAATARRGRGVITAVDALLGIDLLA